ncbi:bifunctional histidinol-phosphatase/imidazoleglycerol-phosphate dehydratase HisB [Fulvivirga lutimaris]|uniref:bifunctional histidinol-phosphatase/imidazoleglycerol-phosphate dehydratase HisB n=1 Tax=Fulvivirga lutimaris TaxID=1819566 RepID=UPI0012BC4AE4|nr:bifunctional histidinol-phosphatase/imidazoleglycerol-phosphate dehydratase HisB [Fulvivirga lutimaris]MTI41571.1 bifunctional histidinol-phosphatase/imidazoleglycerol-phosphate dehydratase HisB [Fulvivirga lutimaris]
MKKVLFIDRDGTIILEPEDEQIDSLEKLDFYPGVINWLSKIIELKSFEIVMVTNQDGLGTDSFPEDTFWPAHNKMLSILKNEGISFDEIFIDKSFEADKSPNRKPGTGMLTKYLNGYDLENSFVIGDRLSDVQLAKNLGAKGILLDSGNKELNDLDEHTALVTEDWSDIYALLTERKASVVRTTKETDINIAINLDGKGQSSIDTGLAFFDHMLDQLSKHGMVDLDIKVKGDLEVDEHHTIEDTAIALGEAFYKALGDKRGISRYGFTIPMDDSLAQVVIDFGGRNWIVWDAEFKREMIGSMPTEMFFHFFKSFSDASKSNLNIKVEGNNEHHKIEAIFKAFARAIRMAIKREDGNDQLPTTKGII